MMNESDAAKFLLEVYSSLGMNSILESSLNNCTVKFERSGRLNFNWTIDDNTLCVEIYGRSISSAVRMVVADFTERVLAKQLGFLRWLRFNFYLVFGIYLISIFVIQAVLIVSGMFELCIGFLTGTLGTTPILFLMEKRITDRYDEDFVTLVSVATSDPPHKIRKQYSRFLSNKSSISYMKSLAQLEIILIMNLVLYSLFLFPP